MLTKFLITTDIPIRTLYLPNNSANEKSHDVMTFIKIGSNENIFYSNSRCSKLKRKAKCGKTKTGYMEDIAGDKSNNIAAIRRML
ncbi:Hypothetical predicted protein [Octopus vulgaris]|uniref:Uncharacterized protein n=1 Tax=Octopus vulgaris TaxID=6645 RepID=A0AA36APY9_OCTVU|nr:Hypothetical predicted protein [Octopus vulgaris]